MFGHSEEKVKEVFHSKQMEPVKTQKIEPEKRSLETLSESSGEMLEKDKEFLKEIGGY